MMSASISAPGPASSSAFASPADVARLADPRGYAALSRCHGQNWATGA